MNKAEEILKENEQQLDYPETEIECIRCRQGVESLYVALINSAYDIPLGRYHPQCFLETIMALPLDHSQLLSLVVLYQPSRVGTMKTGTGIG